MNGMNKLNEKIHEAAVPHPLNLNLPSPKQVHPALPRNMSFFLGASQVLPLHAAGFPLTTHFTY